MAVLRRHWPRTVKYHDVLDVNPSYLEPVDIVVGGFPCQDLSLAGNREGLSGARSGLFYELVRIAVGVQCRCLVWENVPGLFSSDGGRDFARVLAHLGECGFVGGWRVLDAEGFGVAQSRRRVFGVFVKRDLGIERVAKILAFTSGVCGNSQASRREGKDVAGTLGAGTDGSGFPVDLDRCGAIAYQCHGATDVGGFGTLRPGKGVSGGVPFVSGTLNAGGKAAGSATQQDAENGLLVFNCNNYDGGQFVESDAVKTLTTSTDRSRAGGLVAFGGNRTSGARDTAAALRAKGGTGHGDFESETFVLRTDQTGSNADPVQQRDTAPALSTGSVPAVGFVQNQREEVRLLEVSGALCGDIGIKQQTMAFQTTVGRSGRGAPQEVAHTLLGSADGSRTDKRPNVMGAGSLRRMTPIEWERLMGWPDNWTLLRDDGKEIADGPRYRMIGNGVVKPVAFWLGSRVRMFL